MIDYCRALLGFAILLSMKLDLERPGPQDLGRCRHRTSEFEGSEVEFGIGLHNDVVGKYGGLELKWESSRDGPPS